MDLFTSHLRPVLLDGYTQWKMQKQKYMLDTGYSYLQKQR